MSIEKQDISDEAKDRVARITGDLEHACWERWGPNFAVIIVRSKVQTEISILVREGELIFKEECQIATTQLASWSSVFDTRDALIRTALERREQRLILQEASKAPSA